MYRSILTLLFVVAAAVPTFAQRPVAPAPAQPAPAVSGPVVDTHAQARLMARRAAVLDAQRQLAEMIYGVRIDSHTTVSNFVTQDDQIRSGISAVIRGAQVTDTRYLPDGVVEVDMELPVHRIQGIINVRFAYPSDVFRATGTGVPNPVAEPARPTVIAPEAEPDWRSLIISATGTGAAPAHMAGTGQGYAMARRAAQLDAYRNLGENVMGVRIDSQTTVRNFVTERDDIQSRFNGFIQGAQIVEVRELPDGIVEVDMQIALDQLGNILPLPSRPTPRQVAPPPATTLPATGTGVAPRQLPAPVQPQRQPADGYSF